MALISCDVKLRSPIKLDILFLNFVGEFYHLIKSPAFDFANRRVNLRSALQNCDALVTVKRFGKNFKP
jgi:hypothetical protein